MARSKRVRAWDGQPSRAGEGGGVGAGCEEDSLLPASDIAADLGDAVCIHSFTGVHFCVCGCLVVPMWDFCCC